MNRARIQSRSIPELPLLRSIAVGGTIFAWFWLLILADKAWVLAVLFGGFGCAAALLAWRRTEATVADRWLLAACFFLGAVACCVAVLGG